MRRMLPKIFLLFLPDFVQGECAHIEGCGSLLLLAQSHYSNMTRSKTNMRDCAAAAAFALARVIESLSPSNLSSHRSPSIPEIKRERRMGGEFEGRWKR